MGWRDQVRSRAPPVLRERGAALGLHFARVSANELRRDPEDIEGLADLPLLVYVEEDVMYIAFLVWNQPDT